MKVAVFLDYANVNASSYNLGCEIDYGALLRYLADDEEQRFLQAAYAYVPIDPRQEHAMDAVINQLWGEGYLVKSKVGSIAGETYKCDFDVEMTMDISRVVYESKPDIVVLVSGDKDFIPVVLELRGKGIRVEVAAFDMSMSKELARKCSGYINLDFLIEDENNESDFEENHFEVDSARNENLDDDAIRAQLIEENGEDENGEKCNH